MIEDSMKINFWFIAAIENGPAWTAAVVDLRIPVEAFERKRTVSTHEHREISHGDHESRWPSHQWPFTQGPIRQKESHWKTPVALWLAEKICDGLTTGRNVPAP